ncbi:MAG: gliding motility-associated C-terminal domain-containing protein [Flavobacteriales bacterium]|nr:gliding motility-associated C-terminal domain-containing protein [Flavobacteriales bacterium]MCB9193281.1 gliding motility-associated C-terminal domain-containing protein [Flavobacteriales bacterium]
MRHHRPKLRQNLLVLGSLTCLLAQAQVDKYWVGGNGEWSDGANWALTPNGLGGAGEPRNNEAVHIAGPARLTMAGREWCGDLIVDAVRDVVYVEGAANAELTITGDWRMQGDVDWTWRGQVRSLVRKGAADLDLRGIPVAGDLVIDGSGARSAVSDLRLSNSAAIDLRSGTLVTNGNHVVCGDIRVHGGDAQMVAGNSVIDVAGGILADPERPFVDPGSSSLFVKGQAKDWGTFATLSRSAARGITVCGTGAGQTPFTIDAQLLSSYNGFGVSCHGVCDGVVTVTVSGGVGGFSYHWQNGPNTSTWNNSCPGNQIVIVTDQGQGIGCAATIQVTDPPLLGVIFFPPPTPPACAGVCDGHADALAVGGAGGYAYDWNNGAGTGSSFSMLCAGANTLHVTDVNNCAFDTTLDLPLQPIAVTLDLTDAGCFNDCDGSADALVNGGTPNYTYTWSPAPGGGQGTPQVTGLCAGNWSLTVQDANGCDTTIQFLIGQPPPIVPALSTTDATCGDVCDGTAEVTPSGGVGPYSYDWMPGTPDGDGTPAVTGLCAGDWSVLITDQSSGCDTLVAFTIGAPPAIMVTTGSTDATCSDACDGTASVLPVSGGTPGYMFLWSPEPGGGQGTGSATGLCPGDWTVLVTDAAGCDTLVTFTIGAPPPLDVSLLPMDATCAGACDGAASITIAGGTPGYNIVWSPNPPNGQGTTAINGLCAGDWSVTVMDAAGCDTTLDFTIEEPPPLDVIATRTDISCGVLCDGTASVIVSGGTPAYDYAWSPAPGGGQGTPDATGLCAGVYGLLITDDAGCTFPVEFTVQAPVPLLFALSTEDASCPGVCDGSANVIVSGGTPPYDYQWSPAPGAGQGTPNVSGLCAGGYQLTVTDSVGCDSTIAFTIAAPDAILPNATVNPPTCAAICNGEIDLTPTGGNGAFTYTWSPVPSNGQGNAIATGLCAGQWLVTITSGACDTTITFDLQAPPPLDVSWMATDVTCAGACNGAVDVLVDGGTAGYDYLWSPAPSSGQGTANAIGFCAGNVQLTITDANGCDSTLTIPIAAPDPIDVLLTLVDAGCGGVCDGTASAQVSGGSGQFTYDWQPPPGGGQGTPDATGLCPGPYSLTLIDSAGCDTTIAFTIASPSGIMATPQVTDASCADLCDGAIDLVLSGGLPPYDYDWSPMPGTGQGTPNVTGLCDGPWTVVIGDQAGCDTVLVIAVGAPPAIDPQLTVTNETCNGPCDGTASLMVNGGQPPFQYLWSPQPGTGQGTPDVTGLCAGAWSVTVTDLGGCDTTLVFDVLPEQPIDAELTATDAVCSGVCNGVANVQVSGGVGPYNFHWTPEPAMGQATDSVSGLCLGDWDVLITDAAGCDTTIAFHIDKLPSIIPSLAVSNETCDGPCTGAAAVFPSGGTGVLTYDWQPPPGSGQGTSFVSGLCAGTSYSVTIADSLGCDTTVSFMIGPFEPIVPQVSSTPASCPGVCDATITAGATGGEAPYTYFWDPVPPNGQGVGQATGLCAGEVYTVTIVDDNGCDTLVTVTVVGPDPIDAGAVVQPVACAGECNGSIVLNPSGGNGGYLFTWSPVPPNGDGGNGAFDLCAGDWSVTITDGQGCDSTFTFTLDDPAPIDLTVSATSSECQLCNGSAAVDISGGVPPLVIVWTDQDANTISIDTLVTDLCAGIYTVTVTDLHGCSSMATAAVTDSDGEMIQAQDGGTSCPNTCDGQASVTYVCNNPPCTVQWTTMLGVPIGQTADTAVGLCAGSYLVEVTNGTGCVSIDTAQVNAPDPIVPNLSTTPASCAGVCDGTATVGPTGGVGPFSYDWSPDPIAGDGTSQATGLCPGVYDVLITDLGAGCDTTVSVLILGPDPITVDAYVDPITCSGDCDASIVLSPSGGNGAFDFDWTPDPPNGDGTNAAFDLCAGDWTVLITDANGCDTTITFTIDDPAPLVLDGSSTPSACQVCNGTASVNVSGGQAPYAIQWSDQNGNNAGSGTALTDLCAGLYTVTVTDTAGCSAMLLLPVQDGDGETVDAIDGQTTCASNCDGTVSVQLNCTDGPCVVTWFNDQGDTLASNVNTLTDLCTGIYIALVTNNSGCVTIDTAMVVPGTVIIPNLSTSPATCAGVCDGTATVGPTGGVGPYAYDWGPDPVNGDGTSQATDLCTGVYSVHIIDSGGGCDTTVQVLITEPSPLSVQASVEDVACNSACDGSIVLTPAGGNGSYTFSWDPVPPNGDGSNGAFDLCAGQWSVTIGDLGGCDTTIVFTITEPDPLVSIGASTPSECGVCNGTAVVSPTGGTPPYTYAWTLNSAPFGTDSLIVDLCAGIYMVSVQDQNGCQQTLLVPVTDNNGEEVTTIDGSTGCPGECNGEVSAQFLCSDPPCTVAWFDANGVDLNESGTTVDSLCAGPYYVQVTNATGCITIDTAQVIEPDPIVPNLSTTPASCAGSCDGTATVGPSGGVPPYAYDWAPDPINGDGTPQAIDLCAGNYTVTITDSVGCSILVDVLILEPQPVTADAAITPITCAGSCDGGIALTTMGGNGVYQYDWTPDPPNGDGTNSATDLCAGSWSVLITDTNGCDTTYTFELTEPPALIGDVVTTDNVCYGDCMGTGVLTVSGGVPPYTILWSDSTGTVFVQDTLQVDALCAGDYTVIIADSVGCTLTVPFSIGQNTAIEANLVFTNETCFGPCDGTAAVAPTGGVGAIYTYDWQPQPPLGQGTQQVSGLCPGDWSVMIADSLGCDTTYQFTILPFQPIVPNEQVANISCNGACDGSVLLNPSGGFGNYSYDWSPVPPNGQGNAEATSLCPGSYSVAITDGVGCDTTVTFMITEPDELVVQLDQVVDASCSNANDGSIAITIAGGTPTYAISWAGPDNYTSDQEDLNDLYFGDYTLVVTDANGCQTSLNVTVNALSTVVADAQAQGTICAGIPVVLDASGSTGAVDYLWTDQQNDPVGSTAIVTLNGLAPGTYIYTLTVTDGVCSDQAQVTVEVLALPLADAGPDQTIFTNGEAVLGGDPSGPPGSTFSWSPDSLVSTPNGPNPSTSPGETTWFVLSVTAQNGCTDVDSVLITVVPDINIPSGFSPNDDGWNDVWEIDRIDMFPDCEVEVYNRWGELLFQSVGYKEPWDGKYNGSYVPVGTYYYAIRLNDPEFPDPYTGPLTVIR